MSFDVGSGPQAQDVLRSSLIFWLFVVFRRHSDYVKVDGWVASGLTGVKALRASSAALWPFG